MGMDTDGKFSGLEGNIKFNPTDLKTSFFKVSIDANTVNTDIEARDNNLRETDYLDVKKYPHISFASKQITRVGKTDVFILKGIVTIKGITKEITFPFTAVPRDDGILFAGECKLNRRDFKIGMGSIVLSDNMMVVLSVFAKKG